MLANLHFINFSTREFILVGIIVLLLCTILLFNKGLQKSSTLIKELTQENRLLKNGGVIDEEEVLY